MIENKSTSENDKLVEWGGNINEFFWLCSGVNRKVLRQCPTEYAKYAGMGGTIFFTACMAALSGGYAISTVFDNTVVSVLFGIFWGMLIFNLDRLIVNTMYSDGKVTISWREFISGLPRIIMAIFLGIVISTPLELKIYEKSIESQIEELKEKELKKFIAADETKLSDKEIQRDEIANRPLTDEGTTTMEGVFSETHQERMKLETQRNQLTAEIRHLQSIRSGVSPMDNSVYYQKLTRNINEKSIKRNGLNRKISELATKEQISTEERTAAINTNRQNRNEELKRIDADIENLKLKIENAKNVYAPKLSKKYDGFQGRMAAYNDMKYDKRNEGDKTPWFLLWLCDEDKKLNSTWWAALFISLLFIIIECAPTFLRMMVADGSYENMLKVENHRVKVLAEKRISDLNDEVNTEVQISTQKNKERLDAEVLANKKLMERIAKTQAELLQTAIDKWREEELAKINENPSMYIQSNSAQS